MLADRRRATAQALKCDVPIDSGRYERGVLIPYHGKLIRYKTQRDSQRARKVHKRDSEHDATIG